MPTKQRLGPPAYRPATSGLKAPPAYRPAAPASQLRPQSKLSAPPVFRPTPPAESRGAIQRATENKTPGASLWAGRSFLKSSGGPGGSGGSGGDEGEFTPVVSKGAKTKAKRSKTAQDILDDAQSKLASWSRTADLNTGWGTEVSTGTFAEIMSGADELGCTVAPFLRSGTTKSAINLWVRGLSSSSVPGGALFNYHVYRAS